MTRWDFALYGSTLRAAAMMGLVSNARAFVLNSVFHRRRPIRYVILFFVHGNDFMYLNLEKMEKPVKVYP